MLTVEDLCDILRLNKKAVQKMLRQGTITAHKINNKEWRVSRAALQDYLDRTSNKPGSKQ
ncbi:helix-turn-helix domain-containing protein [Thermosporothrix hazakensis]